MQNNNKILGRKGSSVYLPPSPGENKKISKKLFAFFNSPLNAFRLSCIHDLSVSIEWRSKFYFPDICHCYSSLDAFGVHVLYAKVPVHWNKSKIYILLRK